MMSRNDKTITKFDIGIIGCGASGLYLANLIAMERRDLSVAIFERNEIGAKKLNLTGNGKCNFTNSRLSRNCFYSSNPDLVSDILDRFSYEKCLWFYSALGISYCEREGYYYPLTGTAKTVSAVLQKVTDKPNFTTFYRTQIHNVSKSSELFEISDTGGKTYVCQNLVIASGGLAAPSTGSTGDAYYWLQKLGLKVNPRFPALVPLRYADSSLDQLEGCRIKAGLFYGDIRDYGEVQFARGHISGIPVLSLSRLAVRDLSEQKEVVLHLNLLFPVQKESINAVIQRAKFGESLRSCLLGLFSEQLIAYLCLCVGCEPDAKASYDLMERLLKTAQDLPILITRAESFAQAQVTAGGVALTSLDQHMMARDVPGLYCIGEVVDVDGICGGYNLQWAFSSAAACAENINKTKF